MTVLQPPGADAALKAMKCAVKECDTKPLTKQQKAEVKAAGKRACAKLGEIKHACVEDKMAKEPGCRSERTFDMSKKPPKVIKDASGAETQGFLDAKKAISAAGLPKVKGRYKRPDVIFGKRAPYAVFDAKFPCPNSVKKGKMGNKMTFPSKKGVKGKDMMSPEQEQAYQDIADGTAQSPGTVEAVSPSDAVGVKC